MKEKIINVSKEDIAINVILESVNDLTKKKIKSFFKYKMILINDKVITNPNVKVKPGDVVKVKFSNQVIPSYNIDIIYEDEDIIVINKPSGLLSIANRKEKEVTAFRLVSSYVKEKNKNNKIFVIHRLDQATSGILMFAKSEKIQEMFQKKWNEIVLKREYIAVVEGKTKKEETIESYLTMNHFQIVHSTSDEDNGWYSKTQYKLIKTDGQNSLIEVNIMTGKRNQIRVHMSEQGHPIVGDKKYGAKQDTIGRLALHASKLELIDPRTNKKIAFQSRAPKEILNIVK